MKKLLLVLLLSSTAFAQVLPPICQNGKVAYFNQKSYIYDFCISAIKVKSQKECEDIMMKKSPAYRLKVQDEFLSKKSKVVCGK